MTPTESTLELLPPGWHDRGLTPREIQVTVRILSGWDNRLIAEDLGCALATVKTHVGRIFDKLGVSSRTALLCAASRAR